ncbi:hypothetical protein CTU88_35110 [Streptomyces sp. JV178]|uniref:hypothetical protein n=1 Tax=Streptomyces sp. JV178 TaxID=858632 RepID=UPI000C1AFDC2|nr:hypothetical protein [Streptomyces sp. JV178]PIM67971.1 hypothetical protein CTU88_35110 [Streptomyces sp. JV178]
MSSAKGRDYTPNSRGPGRVQVDKAVGQSVFAETTSVSIARRLVGIPPRCRWGSRPARSY